MAVQFQVGATYTFNTRAPALLGAIIKNVKILGIVDYNLALTYTNVEATAAALAPMLAPGVSVDPKTYDYIIFQTESGTKSILAVQWINEATIVNVTSTTLNIVVNNITSDDLVKIKEVLLAMGYTNLVLTTV